MAKKQQNLEALKIELQDINKQIMEEETRQNKFLSERSGMPSIMLLCIATDMFGERLEMLYRDRENIQKKISGLKITKK